MKESKYPKKTLVKNYSNQKKKVINLRTKTSPSISSIATDIVTNRVSNNNKIYFSPDQKSNPVKIQNKTLDEKKEINHLLVANKKKIKLKIV